MKKIPCSLLAATLLWFGTSGCATATAPAPQPAPPPPIVTAPSSVIHVVTVAWKAGTTPEQIQAALDGVKALPAAFPGITRVWVKSFKVQNAPGTTLQRTHAFVMEFKDEQALKDYTDSPAQLEWYKLYTPIRGQSTTHDITN